MELPRGRTQTGCVNRVEVLVAKGPLATTIRRRKMWNCRARWKRSREKDEKEKRESEKERKTLERIRQPKATQELESNQNDQGGRPQNKL